MQRLTRSLSLCSLAAAGVVMASGLAGCGGSDVDVPATYEATGLVTLDGEPVKSAKITFVPDSREEGVKEAYGETDANGNFRMATIIPGAGKVDGAVSGTHRVTISKVTMPDTGGGGSGDYGSDSYVPAGIEQIPLEETEPVYHVPKKYGNKTSSGLTADVKPEGGNNYTFELASGEG